MVTVEEEALQQNTGHAESSRDSLAGAGWECRLGAGTYLRLVPPGAKDFSWLSPKTLWRARNDLLARHIADPTDERRGAWVRLLRRLSGGHEAQEYFFSERYAEESSYRLVVMGDTGEGDASQYALVPPLLANEQDALFMLIPGDVVYPAGDINEYPQKFCRPYKDFPSPIHAVPGNHDWYDGLYGFMVYMGGVEPSVQLPRPFGSQGMNLRERLARLIWRQTQRPNPEALERCRTLRADERQRLTQPGPYWVMETESLRLVGIDTGITGHLDREQGRWLRSVSRGSAKPKVLVVGEPIYTDGEYRPLEIEGGGTVDEIVRDPESNYVAVLSGDKHNYQRYPVGLEDGRKIEYIISGGGGAFTHATHKIPEVNLPGVTEKDFRCYPRRGDSLSYYSKLYDQRFGGGRGLLYIPPEQAAAIMAEQLSIEPIRPSDRDVQVTKSSRLAVKIVYPLPGQLRGPWHRFFSELFDPNRPPLFKNYLRVEVSSERVVISCFGVTGCLEHEQDPPIEDRVEISLHTKAACDKTS